MQALIEFAKAKPKLALVLAFIVIAGIGAVLGG